MAEPAQLVHDDRPVVPVFFLSDSTGISAETWATRCSIQFPDVRFERTLFPFITTVEEARRGGRGSSTPPWTGRSRRWCSRRPPRTPSGASWPRRPRAGHRLLRHAHAAGRGDPARARHAPGRPAARRRRHEALQHPDGGGGVHHRARRRPERARRWRRRTSSCSRRRGAARRRRACTSRSSTGCSSPTTRWSPEDLEPRDLPAAGARPRRPLRRPHHDRRAAQPGAQRAAAGVAATRRPTSAAGSCAGPAQMYAAHRIPVIDSSAKSVEEMATMIVQTVTQEAGRSAGS